MKVVFDFAGVLFHWRPDVLLERLLPERARSPQQAAALAAEFFQGYSGDWGEFDRGTLDAATLARRIAQRTGIAVQEARSVIDAVPGELAPLPAAVDLLTRLHHAGRTLYFLSNMPEPYARHLESTYDFLRLFRGGVFSSRAGFIKPEAAIFAHAAQSFGSDEAQLLFIDDIDSNVLAARAAGWQAMQFVDVPQCELELELRGLL
jgi:putative hydrolase of the HAD superfamily